MVVDWSRTFSPCNYATNSETQADNSWQETDSRCRVCGNAAGPAVSCSSSLPISGRRKSKTPRSLRFTKWFPSNACLFLFGIWCFMTLCGGVAADRQLPSLEKLARRNGLLVDLSDRPESPSFQSLEQRDNNNGGSATSSIP